MPTEDISLAKEPTYFAPDASASRGNPEKLTREPEWESGRSLGLRS
jgi:hypothetical protein